MNVSMAFVMKTVKTCLEVTIVNVLRATVNMSTGRAVWILMSAGWELCVVMAPVLMLLVLTTATAKLVQTLTNSKVHVDLGVTLMSAVTAHASLAVHHMVHPTMFVAAPLATNALDKATASRPFLQLI